jgi:ApbE superfamily uncharacterized protein (UPF0280 family)
MTAEYLKSQGAIKAIVENGGDVAIFLAPDQVAKVGVRLKITEPKPALFMELRGQDQATWGVCSSGFGGRGLTLGVADMAMCVAKSAALADAAATAVANACWVDSPSIKRLPAELVRPETDIPGLMVTSRIGELNNSEVTQALSQSLGLANKLVQQDHLLGAMVALNGQLVTTNDFRQRIAQLEGLNP